MHPDAVGVAAERLPMSARGASAAVLLEQPALARLGSSGHTIVRARSGVAPLLTDPFSALHAVALPTISNLGEYSLFAEIFRGNFILTERGPAQTSLRMPKHQSRRGVCSVSYTHLTLPTILLV